MFRWAVVAAWALVYVPLSVSSLLGEGAGSLGAIVVFALWAVGPLAIMVAAASLGDRTPRPWIVRMGGALLLIPLVVLLSQIVPSPNSNRDLMLPAALLAAFAGLMFVSRPHKTSIPGAA